MLTETEAAALIDKLHAAVDRTVSDLGFTAPELFPMRFDQLKDRLGNAVLETQEGWDDAR